MSLTRTEARDEMLGVVTTALKGHSAGFTILYADDASKSPPKDKKAWAFVSVVHVSGGQVTLGGRGDRTFRSYGYLGIELYTPEGDGFTLADQLAILVTNALEGETTAGGVIFRAVRASEDGKSGAFQKTTITADFEYDQTK